MVGCEVARPAETQNLWSASTTLSPRVDAFP